MYWLASTSALSLSILAGAAALRWQRPAAVWLSGLLLNAAVSLAWWEVSPGDLASLLAIQAVGLGLGAAIWIAFDRLLRRGVPHFQTAGRRWVFAPAAVCAGLLVTGGLASAALVRCLVELPPRSWRVEDWTALAAIGIALTVGLGDRTARFSLPGLYAWGLTALGFAQVQRGFAPARFFLWGGLCDLAGYLLVAALLGWAMVFVSRRWTATAPEPTAWFPGVQALLVLLVAAWTVWIAVDVSFDGMGTGVALLGLTGRSAACPAALMLLGTAILMAWQSQGRPRARWQYAALALGMLFTVSIGWAMIDAANLSPWRQRGVNLLISASMMTFMTGFGLRRVLPRGSDWVQRGRRAMPAFGTLAAVLAILLVAARLLQA